MPKAAQGILSRLVEDLHVLPNDALLRLAPILAAAEKEASIALQSWLSTVPDGSERFTAQHRRAVLLQLRRAGRYSKFRTKYPRLPAWVESLRHGLYEALSQVFGKTAKMSSTYLVEEINRLGTKFGVDLPVINIQVMDLIAEGSRTLVPRFASSAAKYAGGTWQQIKGQLSVSVARNQTIEQMVQRLRKLGGPQSTDPAFGLFSRFRYQAERLVRTEVMNAYNQVHHSALELAHKQEPGLQKRWDAAMDLRLCWTCRSLHGQVVDLDQSFPGGFQAPPAHPNCRCVVTAWHVAWTHDRLPT